MDYAALMNILQFRFSDWSFRPSWLGAVITVCCMALCIKLGLWQYHKAEQKRALQQQYERYLTAYPVALPLHIPQPQDWKYRAVKVQGVYLTQYQFFLDNQLQGEDVGYHVITPLQIDQAHVLVLVDRGWIPALEQHRDTPQVATPAGKVEVTGHVWLPADKFFSLEKPALEKSASWQAIWQNMDMTRLQASLPMAVMPVVIRLAADNSQAGGFVRDWPQPAERITTHIGYAYQWFGFAFAALAIYIVVSFKRKALV
jgi:surfeit locus 1 family protein